MGRVCSGDFLPEDASNESGYLIQTGLFFKFMLCAGLVSAVVALFITVTALSV